MDIKEIVEEITKHKLTENERTKINDTLSGKRKLIYGDEEMTPIFKKINEIESIFREASSKKEAIEKYVKKEISRYKMDIECLEDEIGGYNYKIDQLQDTLGKIQ